MKTIVLSLVLMLSAAFAHSTRAADSVAEWNVLFFLNGKNNLQHEMQEFVLKNLYFMSDVNRGKNIPLHLPSNINILVEYGTMARDCDESLRADHDLDLCNTGVKRFRMIKGLDQVTERDSAFQNLGNVDMGDVNSLVDFVAWSKKFPARHTLLYIFDHGSDFTTSENGLFSFDDVTGNSMNAREIAVGFRKMANVLGRPIDLFVTDMCLVGSAEALGEMVGSLRYYVASRDNVSGYSLSVIDILRVLERLPGVNAKRWAYQIVQLASRAKTPTNFAAFALERMPTFEESLAGMVDALRAAPAHDRLAFQSHFLEACRFPRIGADDSFDFRDILSCMYTMPGMRQWPEFEALYQAFFDVMFTNSPDMNNSGLSIWGGSYRAANATPKALADYRTLRFDQSAHWSDFIELLGTGRDPRL